MSSLSDLINSDAVKRLLSEQWDGSPVQYMQKYDMERMPMFNQLLQRLELPDKNVIFVQQFRKNSSRYHMTRSKSSGSSTLYMDDDVSDDESCLAELTGCPLEWNPGHQPQSLSLIESPPFDSQINSPMTPCVPSALAPQFKTPMNSHHSLSFVNLRALPADEATSVLMSLSSVLTNCLSVGTPDGPPRAVPPIWVPCDGTDPQYTAFLGQHKAEGVSSRVVVTCRGPVETKDLPTYSCILRKHFWGVSQQHCHTTTQLTARYNVLNIYSLSEPQFACSANDCMTIDCCWSGKAASLLQAPIMDAVCHLTVHISPGNEKSPCRSIYKEVLHLQNLVNSLTSGEMAWQRDYSSPPFMEKIRNLCKGARRASLKTGQNVKQSALDAAWDMADYNICIETVVASKRQAVDFTDELWTIIYGCANFQELKDALSYVFNQVQSGQIKPYIARNNYTQMASLIRDMSQKLCAEPTLCGVTPLTMVAEIGLQKLQRDYLNLFNGLELASLEQLQCFFKPPGKSLAELTLAVSELLKVQGVLDMVMLCKINLHLPIHYLSGYAREALKTLANSCSNSQRFRFPLKVPLVRAIFDTLPPEEWTASMKSRQGSYAIHTITHISQKCPFTHMTRDTSYEPHYNPRDPDFYCTIVTCTQDKLR